MSPAPIIPSLADRRALAEQLREAIAERDDALRALPGFGLFMAELAGRISIHSEKLIAYLTAFREGVKAADYEDERGGA